MVTCPKCRSNVRTPIRTFLIPSNSGQEGNGRERIGIFECHSCGVRFRHAIKTVPEKTASIMNMVERIKVIQGELMHTLMSLREKINTLETERAGLMVEITKLRKVAESRADALENEVIKLRSEVKSLKELLGYKREQETCSD